jgi:predicted Zn-dependent protease
MARQVADMTAGEGERIEEPARPRAWRSRRTYLFAAVLILVAATVAGRQWHRRTRPDALLARGLEAVERRDWQVADGLADRLTTSGHGDHAHLLRAELAFARKQPADALAESNQVRDEALKLRAALVNGKSLLELGAVRQADEVFNYLLEREPYNVDAHRGVAAAAYQLGQLERAVDHLNHVVQLDPDDARPHRMLAEIYDERGKTALAVNECREALRVGTGLSDRARDEVRFELAHGLVDLKQFEPALDVLDEAGGGADEPPYMQALRVEALRGIGRSAEAVAVVDRAMAAHPDAVFDRLRGQLYLDAGNAKAAIPFLERAARLSPQHYQSHFLLAQAYSAAGRKADAERANARADEIRKSYDLLTALTRAIEARPWDAEVRLRMAEVCEQAGDTEGAAMWRQAAAAVSSHR